MANYTKITNFTAKDALSTGNPSKIIKGSEHDAEYDAIATAIATKQDASGSAANLTALPAAEGGSLRMIGIPAVASASATISFTSGFSSSAYSGYLIVVEGFRPATDGATLTMAMSIDGGSSYISTSTYQGIRSDIGNGIARSDNSGTSTGVIMTTGVGNQADEIVSGVIYLFPERGRGIYNLTYMNASAALLYSDGAFHLPATVNAYRFAFNSGNITSGSMTLYGIKKA